MNLSELLILLFYCLPIATCVICLTICFIKSYLAANKLNEILEHINDNKEIYEIRVDNSFSSIADVGIYYLLALIPVYNIYYMAACIEDLDKHSIKDIVYDYIDDLELKKIFEKNGFDVEKYL